MTLPLNNLATSHSAADILAEYLTQQSLLGGSTLRINEADASAADPLLLLTDTGALDTNPTLTFGTVQSAGVQIRTRGIPTDQIGPRATIVAIYEHLDRMAATVVTYGGHTYRIGAVNHVSGPFPINTDDQRRWEWSLNVRLNITQLT